MGKMMLEGLKVIEMAIFFNRLIILSHSPKSYGSHNNKNYSVSKIPIKIDASTAFGTGTHETTKCCLKALTFISRFSKSNRILDYGCGTGLSGLALQLVGFKNIDGLDVSKEMVSLAEKKSIYRNLNATS